MSAYADHQLAPRAKPPTPEEAQQRREEMFELNEKIKASIGTTRAEAWKLAAYLDLWEDQVGWSALGYDTLNDWLADVDLGMGRTRFYDLIGAYRELKKREVEPAVIQELDHSKVVKVLPAVRQGRANLEDAIDDVKQLGWRDLREKYRDPVSERTDTEPAANAGPSGWDAEPIDDGVRPDGHEKPGPDDQDLQRARDEIDLLERLEKAMHTLEQIDLGINGVSDAARLHGLRCAREQLLSDYPSLER